MAAPFPGKSPWCHLDAVPRPLASSGSSSRELDLLFRVLTAPNLPTRECGRLPWGSFPLRGINKESSLVSEFPRSRSSVRPQRFSRSRRFTPLSALRVCFTPLPRPGFPFQGFAPAAEPDHLVDGSCPPVVVRLTSAVELPRRRRPQPPRLQGLDPGSSSSTSTE
jgi:hypothetical protein